jgi:putative oxidoreductase
MDVKSEFPKALDAALLVARLAPGLMFASSGWLKLTRRDRHQAMIESLRKGHIPATRLMARVVPMFELLAGLALALGFCTGLSASILLVISLVALITVTAKEAASEGAPLLRLSSLLYTPEVLLIALLLVLLATGPGMWSLDATLP